MLEAKQSQQRDNTKETVSKKEQKKSRDGSEKARKSKYVLKPKSELQKPTLFFKPKPFNISSEKAKLRRYFREAYHAIGELSKYRILNATAFIKICKKLYDILLLEQYSNNFVLYNLQLIDGGGGGKKKKHDKYSPLWKELKNIVVDEIKTSNFGSGYFEEYLLKRLEEVYTDILEEDNIPANVAIEELRAPPAKSDLDGNSCLAGLFVGVSFTLLIMCGLLWGG
ncbi:hypothetical protein RFI_09894, partial [Reticulomyxa filosa]